MLITGDKYTRNVYIGVEKFDSKLSQKLMNHSPSFMWGYESSGSAQLALAILLRIAGEEKALRFYHKFKREIIVNCEKDKNFSLKVEDVTAWLKDSEKKPRL